MSGSMVSSVLCSSVTPLSAFLTASMMPLEVRVAPATASTSAEFAATMAAGICSMAGSETPAVSPWLFTVTLVILPPSTVTDTSMLECIPLPVPTNVPSFSEVSATAGTSVMSIMTASSRLRKFLAFFM